MTETVGARLERIAKDRKGWTLAQFAQHLGVTYETARKWVIGTTAPNRNRVPRICLLLDVTPDYVMFGTEPSAMPHHKVTNPDTKGQPPMANTGTNPEDAGSPPYTRRVPVIGVARMGEDGYYTEISTATGHGDGHVEVYTKDANAYALRVRGDSMAPAIKDGWVVVIEPNGSVAPGEYVLVSLHDGRKMVKELLFQRVDAVAVVSVNGDKRITLEPTEIEFIQPVAAIVPPSKWRV